MEPQDADALRPKLQRAQETLQLALDEACAADLRDADTGELIRLEEVLAIANEAAKQAVSVRRRLARERQPAGDATRGAHREIEDERGVRWLVFAVFPSTVTTERAPLPEPYAKGWLAFDSGLETRRIAPIPENWTALSDAELVALCDNAQVSPRRKRGQSPP